MPQDVTLPRVGIVAVVYGDLPDLVDCVRSIGRLSYAARTLYLVDNGSDPDTLRGLRALHQEGTHLIENGENLGYAGGNNVGIRRALADGCDMILLLNPDVVVDAAFLDVMVAAARARPRAGILGPTVRDHADPSRWNAGGMFDPRTGRVWDLTGEGPPPAGDPRPVGYVQGCALLATRAMCEEVGLLDPNYFLYFEDTDWALRAARARYEVLHVPGAAVAHKGSRSTKGPYSPLYVYYYTRNHLLLARRHLGTFHRLLFLARFWRNHVRPSLRAWRTDTPEHRDRRRALWQALRDYAMGRFGKRRYG